VAAGIVVALAAVLATLRPQSDWGGSSLVMVRDTGAVYVRVGDLVHPVLNLTSAQLITGTAQTPRLVTGSAVSGGRRGPLLGIAGAPSAVDTPPAESQLRWTVCDHEQTTVLIGAAQPGLHPLDTAHAALVAGASGRTYLLYDGQRARVDLTDNGVVAALGAENVRPAAVSAALLEMVPEVAPISTPHIAGAGAPGPRALPGFVVGDVFEVRAATDVRYYVVLDGGVQRIGRVAADVLRHHGRGSSVTALAPAAVKSLPELGTLPVQSFPEQLGGLNGDTQAVCVSWQAGSVALMTGSVPQETTGLAGADGAGPHTDAVGLPPGRSVYLADGTGDGAGWLVTELGLRFRVDPEAARVLALGDPTVVPRAVLQTLPPGPVLSRSAALTPVAP